jgi:hypothetical protein
MFAATPLGEALIESEVGPFEHDEYDLPRRQLQRCLCGLPVGDFR